MRVWVVSHAYVAAVNQDKLRALARLPDLDLTLLAPAAWRTAFGLMPLPPPPTPYRVVASRVLGSGRIGAHVYRGGMRELWRARPDIVHAELEPWSLAALQCVLAARRARIVVFTWENLEGPRRLLSRAIERVVLRRAAFVIAGSQQARARLLRRGVPVARTRVLPQFGVDPERYAREGGPEPIAGLAPPVVGYVGRLVPEKGVDLLVDALAPLDARLLVVGDGPARAELERRVAGWPPGKAVFAGGVDHAAVPAWLRGLDALVLPSRTTAAWAEQFGHVLIEAMAAGVPVVGSSSGAIPEVIGDAGLMFPEGDAAALGRQLAWLLGDPAVRAMLARRGRERVRAGYTHEAIAAAQHEIYRELLSPPTV
ncbi:MAG: glycosyltransferase family 4 protein [Candidatus Rokubacteria bacterium]|nr:glycosyltransferase family 4 protein [Candidatus Rokubacteria bacterium]